MISERLRIKNSAIASMSTHGAAFGLYFLLRLAHPVADIPEITQVEFLDWTPAPAAAAPSAAAPAGGAPALPASPKPKAKPVPDFKVKPVSPARGSSAMQELSTHKAAKGAEAWTSVNPAAAISLETVGRREVRSSQAGAIRIDTGSSLKRSSAKLGEIAASAKRSALAGGGQGSGGGGMIELREGPVAGRGAGAGSAFPGGRPGGSLSGGGISLEERPMARPGGALRAAPAPRPARVESRPQQIQAKTKGLEISGPLAGRRLLETYLPPYPDWAKERGIEAEVVIRFFVSPEGRVLETMVLERTSGYKELDDLAMEALRRLVFVPLREGSQEEQWGLITYRFRLK